MATPRDLAARLAALKAKHQAAPCRDPEPAPTEDIDPLPAKATTTPWQDVGVCSSCGAMMRWGKTDTGKRMPLNPRRVVGFMTNDMRHMGPDFSRRSILDDDGAVLSVWVPRDWVRTDGTHHFTTWPGSECSELIQLGPGDKWVQGHESHFATCPNAGAHRRR